MPLVDFFASNVGLTIRFTLLRILCIGALVTSIADLYQLISTRYKYFDFNNASTAAIAFFVAQRLMPLVTFVQHVASAFGPKFSLPGSLDLSFILAELMVLGYRSYWVVISIIWEWPQPENFLVVMLLSLSACLFSLPLLVVVRIADFQHLGMKSVVQQYDFTTPRLASRDLNLECPKPISVLSGRSLWKAHFHGETKWIIISRAITGIGLITALIGIAVWNVVFQPIQEMWLTPTGRLTTLWVPPNAVPEGNTGWSILLMVTQLNVDYETDNTTSFSAALKDATTVNALWPQSTVVEACTFEQYYEGATSINNLTGIGRKRIFNPWGRFYCPSKAPLADKSNRVQPFQSYIHPDFLVSVNFSQLGIPFENESTGTENLVQVVIGLTDDAFLVAQNTLPTTLMPGINLIGMTDVIVRQQLNYNPGALFMDTMNTFLLANVVHVWADPRPVTPSLMNTGPEIATIRLKAQLSSARWQILQDVRDKTILKGFSNIGGLWTSLGGIFVVLFGSSILKIVLGSKGLSFFGAAHSLQKQKIRDACIAEYPRIEQDVTMPHKERGLLRMICDHLLDVRFLTVPESPRGRSPSDVTRLGDVGTTDKGYNKLEKDIEKEYLLEDDLASLHKG